MTQQFSVALLLSVRISAVVHNSYTWMWAIEHSGERYGQLVVYYRANNLVSPDS
jgi:hypothetical protein